MYTYKDGIYRVSVRNLIEFVLRSGDIDDRTGDDAINTDAMLEGSRLHRKIQKKMGSDYTAEVKLATYFDYEEYQICVEGRADGIIVNDKGVTIDEIKTMYCDLQYLTEAKELHKAQAMCYAYMYLRDNDDDNINIQMTYCDIDTEIIKRFHYEYDRKEIETWFEGVLAGFEKWISYIHRARLDRNMSIKKLEFPFTYRDGQKDLVVNVYKAIKLNKPLFIEAPTGVGKTLSTVFPSVKALGEGIADKIFYLTAKTITRTVAYDTFDMLKNNGLSATVLVITAKEKICPCENMACNPDNCPYAKGHFDRVNDAVFDMVTHENMIDRDTVAEYSKKHNVCTFEMSLDSAYWCDAVICDYNYVFDPNVYLKRFFMENVRGDYVFLVDEAHNLIDRAREMYSAVLYKEDFLNVKKLIGKRKNKLTAALNKCNRIMLEYRKESEGCTVHDDISEFMVSLNRVGELMAQFLEENAGIEHKEDILSFYFSVRHFLNMGENMEEDYILYTDTDSERGFFLKEFCVKTSGRLKEKMNKGISTIFFSATLLPVTYFKDMLSDADDYAVYAKSVFDTGRRKLLIANDVTSRYVRRNAAEYNKICRYIDDIVSAKKGNYFVFFPSYRYMLDVYQIFVTMFEDKYSVSVQSSNMDEESREIFLDGFRKENERTHIGFLVLGGIFSEGIDMRGDALIGNIIVGTGLPQVCTERELLKDYFNTYADNGYEYAYEYPGMNKVMQAAGRLIRTESDVGILALLDERFLGSRYRSIFPREWADYEEVNAQTVSHTSQKFWENIE